MIGLMVVLLTFFLGGGPGGKYGFSNMGVGDILRSGCGIQG